MQNAKLYFVPLYLVGAGDVPDEHILKQMVPGAWYLVCKGKRLNVPPATQVTPVENVRSTKVALGKLKRKT